MTLLSKLDFKKLKVITTDGGKNMSGHKTGLVVLVCNAVQNAGGEKPLIFHCIIHQQSLYGKNLNNGDIKQVVKTLNYIRSHALKHHKFKVLQSKIESEYPDHG